jgi:hypothetical protein
MQEPTEKSLDSSAVSIVFPLRFTRMAHRCDVEMWSGFPGMALAQVTMDINGG